MSSSAGAKSIAEVLAEVEKQKAETARRAAREYAQRRQAEAQATAASVSQARKVMTGAAIGSAGRASSAKRPAAAAGGKERPAASAAKTSDLRDEFDYALEAVATAKKSLGRDAVAVEKMAIHILMAKAGVTRDDAPRYIRKAIQYLDS